MRTPWGESQIATELAWGIVEVTTASHGGIHLSPPHNALVHESWRTDGGWYEEDSAVHIVAVTFPHLFPAGWLTTAHQALKDWYPDQYEQALGVTLGVQDSYLLRERAFAEALADKLIVTAAWGHGNAMTVRTRVPQGWVGVVACLGGQWSTATSPEQCWFLVPADEYETSQEIGFVIDPDRHPDWPGLPAWEPGQPVMVWASAAEKQRSRTLFSARKGTEAGVLWRISGTGGSPDRWRAYAAGYGASLMDHDTQEEALLAVGLQLVPFAPLNLAQTCQKIFQSA